MPKKLSDEVIAQIDDSIAAGDKSLRLIAKDLGVSLGAVAKRAKIIEQQGVHKKIDLNEQEKPSVNKESDLYEHSETDFYKNEPESAGVHKKSPVCEHPERVVNTSPPVCEHLRQGVNKSEFAKKDNDVAKKTNNLVYIDNDWAQGMNPAHIWPVLPKKTTTMSPATTSLPKKTKVYLQDPRFEHPPLDFSQKRKEEKVKSWIQIGSALLAGLLVACFAYIEHEHNTYNPDYYVSKSR